MSIELICGDALELLPERDVGSIDAVITDPPFSSGGQFRSDRTQKTVAKYVNTDSVATFRGDFSGDNRDQRAFLAWCSLWMCAAHRASKDGAIFCCCTDWRQIPTMSDAVQCGGWVWRNLLTWWKPGIRMQRGRFSGSAEYVLYSSRGVPTPGPKSPQNVLALNPVAGEDKEHVAEKPIELMRWLLGVVPEGGTVLDPFMGIGTTGVACKELGLNFIGFDISSEYVEIARRRINATTGPLFRQGGA